MFNFLKLFFTVSLVIYSLSAFPFLCPQKAYCPTKDIHSCYVNEPGYYVHVDPWFTQIRPGEYKFFAARGGNNLFANRGRAECVYDYHHSIPSLFFRTYQNDIIIDQQTTPNNWIPTGDFGFFTCGPLVSRETCPFSFLINKK